MRYVDLALFVFAGVADLHAGEHAELHADTCDGIGARNDGLAGDDGGHCCKDDQRDLQHMRGHVEERIIGGGRGAEYQRALAEIIQHDGGEDEEDPGGADRVAAEMAHVGVEGFSAGDR